MSVTILKVGDVAPDFELPSDSGQTVRLSDLRGKRVVLYFYPKDDTSGCTTQAVSYTHLDVYKRQVRGCWAGDPDKQT